MATDPITEFELDAEKLEVIRECMDNSDVGSDDAEWPNNIISQQAVVYASGRIARRGSTVRHAVNPDELTLCQQLSSEVTAIMAGVDVGMGSESSDPFQSFFVVANADEQAPARIDENLIRSCFGGTIFPLATITIEPLAESGIWWSEVLDDGEESEEDDFVPWRAMIEWFRNQEAFVDSAFVRIGDYDDMEDLDEEQFPEGTEMAGSVMPRLAIGVTKGGSLVGLFGYSVQT